MRRGSAAHGALKLECEPLKAACVACLTAQLAKRDEAAANLMAELRAAEAFPREILFDLLEVALGNKRPKLASGV